MVGLHSFFLRDPFRYLFFPYNFFGFSIIFYLIFCRERWLLLLPCIVLRLLSLLSFSPCSIPDNFRWISYISNSYSSFLSYSCAHRALHSFPTLRSSYLFCQIQPTLPLIPSKVRNCWRSGAPRKKICCLSLASVLTKSRTCWISTCLSMPA